MGVDGTATFILGGQVGTEPADILLVYPEGNYIRASEERPFLQIGESKYGKFMLELAVQDVDIDTATSIALGSMMSTGSRTCRSVRRTTAASDLKDSLKPMEFRLQSDSPLLEELREAWERQMRNALTRYSAFRGPIRRSAS